MSMAYCDFVIKHDPDKETSEELTKKIFYSVFIKRLKAQKPCIIFMSGESGEGKSYSALIFQMILLEIQGLYLKDYINHINVYQPLEYPKKLKAILFDKELKKLNIICMHEAREIVKAKLWYNFLNQSISDINAMSRKVKRLITIIISQFIRDISTDIRYTLNYYCVVRRPKNKPARVYINVLWKDDRDLDKPKLKKRKLSGYIVLPNGAYKRYVPKYLECRLPPKEIRDEFDRKDFESKAHIIKKKIDNLIKEMEQDIGETTNKINTMVDWYVGNPTSLNMIGKVYRGKFKLRKEFKTMHEMNDFESIQFEKRLNEELDKQGVVEDGTDELQRL